MAYVFLFLSIGIFSSLQSAINVELTECINYLDNPTGFYGIKRFTFDSMKPIHYKIYGMEKSETCFIGENTIEKQTTINLQTNSLYCNKSNLKLILLDSRGSTFLGQILFSEKSITYIKSSSVMSINRHIWKNNPTYVIDTEFFLKEIKPVEIKKDIEKNKALNFFDLEKYIAIKALSHQESKNQKQ